MVKSIKNIKFMMMNTKEQRRLKDTNQKASLR